jgi:hypothetical protein
MKNMRHACTWLGIALIDAGIQGCGSDPYMIAPMSPVKYQVLGKTEAKSCGAMGFFTSGTTFVSMGLNGRIQRATEEAIAKVPGATSLTNVEMSEDWAWPFFVTIRCTTVRGDAIKETK